MANQKSGPLAQAYYLIRARDVELAEDFYHRCPRDIRTIRELNAFFHQLLAQYPTDTFQLRLKLVDTQDFTVWGQSFVTHVLPHLMLNRFPQNTSLRVSSYYNDLTTLAQRSFGMVAAH